MSAAEDAFSGLRPIKDSFDPAALEAWMAAHVEGFRGPMTMGQFKGGQSNPTYRLDTPGGSYVLRRKPMGALLPSAHAVDREFKAITALHAAGFPVPRTYGLCKDAGVIGSMFYVMAMVEGRTYWNGALPELAREERRPIYAAEIETLAKLHAFDPAAIGLGDYGKPGNYFARQIDRWTRQYRASETDPIAEMDRLIDWLPGSTPAQDRVSIVHGDYRLDNLIFAPDRPVVAAVLDWELSTLGDPLADATYYLMHWALPPDGRSGLAGLDLETLGVPSLEEAVALYCRHTGRHGIENLDWYFAYNLFRLTGIVQGIAGRVRDGTASSAQAVEIAKNARPLAKAAWGFAEKAGAA